MKLIDMLAEGMTVGKVLTGTYNPTTAGDRVNVAHGLKRLGKAVTPSNYRVQVIASDADAALTADQLMIVKVDSTNVVIRGSAKPLTYRIEVS